MRSLIKKGGSIIETLDRFLDNLRNYINHNNIKEQSIEDVFIEIITIFDGDESSFNEEVQNIGGNFLNLYEGFGLIILKLKDLELLKKFNNINEMKFPEEIFFSEFNSESGVIDYEGGIENYRGIYENNEYGLTGKGILIGFVDSGIDFTHPAFKDFKGKTRIKYIYNIVENKAYDSFEIDNALKLKDPYSAILDRDLRGHGTMMASRAAAGGMIPPKYYGVASESSLIMSKIGPEQGFRNNWDVQVMKGIKFLIDKAKELSMPLVINLSINSTRSNFWGMSFLDEYLNRIGGRENITIVASIGNEGESKGHYEGNLLKNEEVILNIDSSESTLTINLVKYKDDLANMKIVTPSGEKLTLDYRQNYAYFNNNKCKIELYRIYRSKDINVETIKIFLKGIKNYITQGEWKFEFYTVEVLNGDFDIWLPTIESINHNTMFKNSTVSNTVAVPGLSQGVIAVGSSKGEIKVSKFSAIGPKRTIYDTKPNVLNDGENVLVASGSWFRRATGTSISAAGVSGIVALLMEWGILRGYDKDLYGNKLKYFIQLGAQRDGEIKYPNNQYGYGVVSFKDTITLLEEHK